MNEQHQPAPRRIFRVTFTRSDGTRFWRYVRCPYQVKGPDDWGDSLVGMQTFLADAVLHGSVERFSISAIAPERTRVAATKSVRWHEVVELLAA